MNQTQLDQNALSSFEQSLKNNHHSRRIFKFCFSILIVFLTFFHEGINGQGTWTKIVNPAPDPNGGGMLLLTDGTVITKTFSGGSGAYGNIYDRLTPDIHGSYVNGTWSSIAPMIKTRLYYSSQVLMDGRVYVAGGEYGSGNSKSETYDPLTDVWTACPNPGTTSDANSELLPDGKVLQALVSGNLKKTKIYDPETNTYVDGPDCIGIHNESTWVKLPDSSILMVDRGETTSERYIPSLNLWIADADVPVDLYDQWGLESGGGLLLPDGRVWMVGSLGHTAYYTPSGNTSTGSWEAGPDVPAGKGTPDAPVAMMVSGKILMAVSPAASASNVFPTPTTFYEFDYTTNTFTSITTPSGAASNNIPCYVTGMVDLPDGSVLCTFQDSTNYYIYTPDGAPLAEGKPTITGITQNGCTSTYTLTGTLFNGISEGAAYGDDWQMATNYPIVRMTSSSGDVYYGRTYNWNSNGVARGSNADTTQLTIPANLPFETFSLVVVANGIASDPIEFTPFGAAITALSDTNLCIGEEVILSANTGTGLTYQWQVDGLDIPGETSSLLTADQTGNYSVVVSNTAGCDTLSNSIHVAVNPSPLAVISYSETTSFCEGGSVTLNANEGSGLSYQWQVDGLDIPGETNSSYNATLPGDYTVNVDSISCTSISNSVSVIVYPLPAVTATASDLVLCTGESSDLTAEGASTYLWQPGNLSGQTVTVSPTSDATYVVTGTDVNECTDTAEVMIQVNPIPVIYLGNDTTVCDTSSFVLDAGDGYTSYLWSTGATTQSIIVGGSATYTATVTDANGCSGSDAVVVTVTSCTGIENIETATASVNLFPNPNNGNFSIDLSFNNEAIDEEAELQIVNVTGQIILREKIAIVHGNAQQEIFLDDPADGMYFVRVILSDQNQILKRVVIAK